VSGPRPRSDVTLRIAKTAHADHDHRSPRQSAERDSGESTNRGGEIPFREIIVTVLPMGGPPIGDALRVRGAAASAPHQPSIRLLTPVRLKNQSNR